MNAETFNGLMQQVSRLTLRQRALLRKRLDEVDGQAQGFAVIESQSVTEPRSCPHCQGTSLYLHGQVNGLQRYRCQACRRTFNALTGTALARLRKKDKWLGFSGALVASQPFRPAAATLGVHRNTALRDRTRGLVGHKTNADSWRLHALPETYHGQRPFDGRAKKGPCVACDGTERRSCAISKIKWTTIVKPIMAGLPAGVASGQLRLANGRVSRKLPKIHRVGVLQTYYFSNCVHAVILKHRLLRPPKKPLVSMNGFVMDMLRRSSPPLNAH